MSDYLAPRGRQRSRWWLAGLLIGCMLPVGLIQGNTPRLSARIVHACLLAPAAIRAESRRHASRRRHPVRDAAWLPFIAPLRFTVLFGRAKPDLAQPSVGHDTLSRRGPPCSADT